MIRLALIIGLSAFGAVATTAQPARKETDVAKQRAAVEAWTSCIADENAERAAAALNRDFRTREYRTEITALAKTRVSSRCFQAMPVAYRKIELGGLPFAGGLAERLIERNDTPLLTRLSQAANNPLPPAYAPSDQIAQCMVQRAPNLVAKLFATPIVSDEENKALAALTPITEACSQGGPRLEATPLAMRSMLATASFRMLAAAQES